MAKNYPIQICSYKGHDYTFNKYGRTEFTMMHEGEELFFASLVDVKYFIDVYLLKESIA